MNRLGAPNPLKFPRIEAGRFQEESSIQRHQGPPPNQLSLSGIS
jgi:hypothetical protein